MENVIKSKKTQISSREVLLNLSKEDLIEKIIQLEAHRAQLQNIISKKQSENDTKSRDNRKRPFDFAKCHTRRVLLQIMYFGWNYQGLAVQEDTTQTIEDHLFEALKKSCLIESRETSGYHRCGRTDKGVSSFGQVISISLRSKYPPSDQYQPGSITSEIQYCKVLNRLLPEDIRVVGWMPIPSDKPEFSARFDCKKRTYKYYFPRSNLNLSAMQSACSLIIGSHDFRNLCKMDVGNGVITYTREIFNAVIIPVDNNDISSTTSMYCLKIEGNAFLWHQIRCIMAVLLLIGQGKEEPGVITQLLDVEKFDRKPQYNMALDVPLNLFHCEYEMGDTSEWVCDRDDMRSVISELQYIWTLHSIKTTMIKDVLSHLEDRYKKSTSASETADMGDNASDRDRVIAHTDCLFLGVKPKKYTPLLERVTCPSLEEKIEHYKKKRKIMDSKDEEK